MPCRHSHSHTSRQRAPRFSFLNSSTHYINFPPSKRPHTPFLDHPKPPFLPRLWFSWAMTLSRIHLPSISSVLMSERVFLQGQFVSTKSDMDAVETKSLPGPDFLMVCRVILLSVGVLNTRYSQRTIHLDEAPCVGHQVSSFSIGHNLVCCCCQSRSNIPSNIDIGYYHRRRRIRCKDNDRRTTLCSARNIIKEF